MVIYYRKLKDCRYVENGISLDSIDINIYIFFI